MLCMTVVCSAMHTHTHMSSSKICVLVLVLGERLARTASPKLSVICQIGHERLVSLAVTFTLHDVHIIHRPNHLSLNPYVPLYTLRSFSSASLHVPHSLLAPFRFMLVVYCRSSCLEFSPFTICLYLTLNTLWKHLKTHLFLSAFNSLVQHL